MNTPRLFSVPLSVVVLSVIAVTWSAAVTPTTFAPSVTYSVGANDIPNGVATGDFNKDGFDDLVVTTFAASSVSIFLNAGDGTFLPRSTVAVDNDTDGVVVADFDGDLNLDLAVVVTDSNEVSILHGDGSGGFGRKTDIPTGAGPTSITVADFNGDNRPDFATCNFLANSVTVVLNNGGGGFTTRDYVLSGRLCLAITSGDFNGDNRPDLAVTGTPDSSVDDGNLAILTNDGAGGISSIGYLDGGPSARDLTSADFNGDGLDDLAIQNDFGAWVLLAQAGGFGTPAQYVVSQPSAIGHDDLNGDGNLDLFVGGSVAMTTWEGNGTGLFVARRSATLFGTSRGVASGNFDNDGRPDVVQISGQSSVSVLINTSSDVPQLGLGGAPDGSGTTLNITEGDGPAVIAPLLAVSDDGGTLASATVTIADPDRVYEALEVTGGPGLTTEYDPLAGVLSIRGVAPLETYRDVLRSVTYLNRSLDPPAAPRELSFVVDDGSTSSSAAVATVNIARLGAATVFVVNTLDDLDDGECTPGHCSLREAINAANADPGSEVITFAEGVTGTIELLSPLPEPSGPLEIRGSGAGVLAIEVSDGSSGRHFSVPRGVRLTLGGLSLVNGDVTTDTNPFGGSITNAGELRIEDCVLTGNRAREGGAVHNAGSLQLVRSTISGNHAARGGAVHNSITEGPGELLISNSTISGNSASVRGGGIYHLAGSAAVRSSTLTANSAPSGRGSAIACHGDGAASLQLTASIVAGNLIENNDLALFGGTTMGFTSAGHNLLGGGDLIATFATDNDLTGFDDPRLGPLQDNGGPTPTHLPASDSPALEGAGETGLTEGQRGITRPQGIHDDIGSIEVESSTFVGSLVVTTLLDEDDGSSMPALGSGTSLREAIKFSETLAGSDVITFAPEVVGTAWLTRTLPEITGELRISGPGADKLTFRLDQTKNPARLLTVPSGATVEISGLTLSGGRAFEFTDPQNFGGCIASYGALTLRDSVISENLSRSGSAVANLGGSLVVSGCTFTGNIATDEGAIYSSFGVTTVTNSTISGNRGGGVFNAGELTVSNSTITENVGNGITSSFGSDTSPVLTEVSNSIVAGNSGEDTRIVFGRNTFLSLGHNLVGGGTGASSFSALGDQVGVDPGLSPLAKMGGPTPTHVPLPGSPAIDSGSSSLGSDQRGASRPGGSSSDIGSVEVLAPQSGPDFLVTAPGDSEFCDLAFCSLRGAILAANSNPDSSVIRFAAGVGGTVDIESALPPIETRITFEGPGAEDLVIRRKPGTSAEFRIFHVASGSVSFFNNLTISGGVASGDGTAGMGGAIFNEGVMGMTGCVLAENSARAGGAIASVGPQFRVTDSVIRGNSAESGGGLFNQHGNLIMRNSAVLGNQAVFGGGGLSNFVLDVGESAFCLLINSTFSGNATDSPPAGGFVNFNGGGAILTISLGDSGAALIEASHCTFTNNSVSNGLGAALYSVQGSVMLKNSLAVGNTRIDTVESTSSSEADVQLSISAEDEVSGSLIGVPDGLDPGDVIGPLGNYGGSTPTVPLPPGSPAIGFANNLFVPPGIVHDQRGTGFARLIGANPDAGAYEAPATAILADRTTEFESGLAAKFSIDEVLESLPVTDGREWFLQSLAPTVQPGSSVRVSNGFIVYQSGPGQKSGELLTYLLSDGVNSYSGNLVFTPRENPDQPTSNINSIRIDAGEATVTAAGIPLRVYQLQYSDTMAEGSWRPVGDPFSCPADGIMTFRDSGPLPTSRFYRVVDPDN